jgi:hypothetical protein
VHRAGPEPGAVFTPDQWTEIAKAIPLDRITFKEKKAICDAILAYSFLCLGNERATDETSGESTRRRVDPRAKGRAALRDAFHSVEKYLNREDLILEAQQLTERIFKFQKLAKQELDKKSVGGRSAKKIRDYLVIRLGVIYERLTGKKPTRSVDRNGQVRGPFPRFVYTIFQAKRIPLIGLPNAIEKAVRYAKNRH